MNFLGPVPYGAYKTEDPYDNPRHFWKSGNLKLPCGTRASTE